MNETAKQLCEAIEKYINESSKVGYKFELEEQLKIEQMIKILNNQIDMLIQYEISRKEK